MTLEELIQQLNDVLRVVPPDSTVTINMGGKTGNIARIDGARDKVVLEVLAQG